MSRSRRRDAGSSPGGATIPDATPRPLRSDLLEAARRAWEHPRETPTRPARIGLASLAVVPLVFLTQLGNFVVFLGLLLAAGVGLVAGAVAVARGEDRSIRLDRIVTGFGLWALGLAAWFLLSLGPIAVRGLGTASPPPALGDLASAFAPAWLASYVVLVGWAAWPWGDRLARGTWVAAAGFAAFGVLRAALGAGNPYGAVPAAFALTLVGLVWAIVREWLPIDAVERAALRD